MIYILAQGEGKRWSEIVTDQHVPAHYKQQTPINGESLIMRTVRMIEEYDLDFKIIAKGEIFSHPQLDRLVNRIITLNCPGNILSGIYQVLCEASRCNNTILLGDVIFSRQLMADILTCDEREHTLWGRCGPNPITGKEAGEIFALTVSKEMHEEVKHRMSYVRAEGEKLWYYYNHISFDGNWVEVSDYTDDIDSIQEYNLFFPALDAAVKEDDKE